MCTVGSSKGCANPQTSNTSEATWWSERNSVDSPTLTTKHYQHQFYLFHSYWVIRTCNSKHSINVSLSSNYGMFIIFCTNFSSQDCWPTAACYVDVYGVYSSSTPSVYPQPHPHPERPFTIESPWGLSMSFYESLLLKSPACWSTNSVLFMFFLHKHNKVLYRKYILTLKITWFTQNQILFLLLKYRVCTYLRLNITCRFKWEIQDSLSYNF